MAPTAQQLVEAQVTPLRLPLTPEVEAVHVPPPLAEVRIVPLPLVGALPTTTHPTELHETPSRVTVTPEV
jgi:hypothetical protein